MERILISACLLGERVRYHGGDARCEHPTLRRWQDEGRLVPLCPEVTGGLRQAHEYVARQRASIAESGRFLTFSSGQATIGFRMRPDPAERNALRVVKETPEGLYLTGRVGMFGLLP